VPDLPSFVFFPGPPGARDLADSLPEDQPVYEIYWPNMDGEISFPTVEQLAEIFVQDIRKLQAHGPYQFCGYSTFGLVAYEMGCCSLVRVRKSRSSPYSTYGTPNFVKC